MFGFQHIIFILARLALLIVINTVCFGCCCFEDDAVELRYIGDNPNEERNEYDPFADRIISFEYEKFIVNTH